MVQEPQWPEGSHARILVEAAEWAEREHLSNVLRSAGYATAACPGPSGADERCPLATGHRCKAAEQADVVVHALRPTDDRNREVLHLLRRRLPRTPVVVEAPEPYVAQHPEDFEGCDVVYPPLTKDKLLDAVERALARRA